MSSANSLNLDQSKVLSFGNEKAFANDNSNSAKDDDCYQYG